jgi:hypothetical protein
MVRTVSDWPDSGAMGWALLGAVLLSLLPVALVFLDGVAGRNGELEWKGLRLSFAGAATPAQGAMVPPNVTSPGTPVVDSGMQSVLRTSEAAARDRLLVVDLASGQAWWESRLLMLCAVAAAGPRQGAVVFVAELSGQPNRFLGWATPAAVRDQLLASRPELRAAYQSAAADSVRTALGQATTVPMLSPSETAPPLVPSGQHLAQHIGRIEAEHRKPLSASGMQDLLAPVLITRSVDRTTDPQAWTTAALASQDDFIAVTDNGRYVGLMTWRSVVDTLLLGLVQQSSFTRA